MDIWADLGVRPWDILLPKEDVDAKAYSVVACDQFTGEPAYWEEVETLVGEKPSTLRLTYPEIYLSHRPEARIAAINAAMEDYLARGLFRTAENALLYIERTLAGGRIRKGLVLAVDLEQYDYQKGSQSLIRATEGTIEDRLPPRVRIRENAPLELPHIMLLIDDPECTVIAPLANAGLAPCYATDLMMGGGSIKGFVTDAAAQNQIALALQKLADPAAFRAKYGVGEDKGVLLYAVGDGNHSLATAKVCWERIKTTLSPEEQAVHPARYALCELVNLHDAALEFEPIHRVLYGVNTAHILAALHEKFAFGLQEGQTQGQILDYISADGEGEVHVPFPKHQLTVGTLQAFLDEFLKENPQVEIDYIHGDDVTRHIGSRMGNMGFLLPAMSKSDLFRTVIIDGVLPRKTFSMGEGRDKRYYFEARRIK